MMKIGSLSKKISSAVVFATIVLIVAISCSGVSAQQSTTTATVKGIHTSVSVTDGATVNIHTNPTDQTATFEMTYAGQAWISVAFSKTGSMVGSSAVIGLNNVGMPQKYDMTSTQLSGVTLVQSNTIQGTLTDTIFTQNDTHTYMKFTRPLVDSGSPEIFLDGTQNIFLYGIGYDNNFNVHKERGNFVLSLAACDPSTDPNCSTAVAQTIESPNKTLWMAHGLCMVIAWAILIPLGVGASRLRKLFPAGGIWFQLHRALNMTGVALTITGFVLAYIATKKGGSKHFTTSLHQSLGLAISILAVLQAINGIFRPHAPTPTSTSASAATKTNEQLEAKLGSSDEVAGAGSTQEVYGDELDDSDRSKDKAHASTKTTARTVWEPCHIFLGVSLLALAWFNCYTGLDEYDERFDMYYGTALWSIIGTVVGILLVLSISLQFCGRKQ